jgi:hypothetical protein
MIRAQDFLVVQDVPSSSGVVPEAILLATVVSCPSAEVGTPKKVGVLIMRGESSMRLTLDGARKLSAALCETISQAETRAGRLEWGEVL